MLEGKVDRCTLTDNRELTAPDEVIRHFAPPGCSLSDPLRLPRLGVVISCPPKRDHRLELPPLPTKIELARSDNFIHALPIRTQRAINLELTEIRGSNLSNRTASDGVPWHSQSESGMAPGVVPPFSASRRHG